VGEVAKAPGNPPHGPPAPLVPSSEHGHTDHQIGRSRAYTTPRDLGAHAHEVTRRAEGLPRRHVTEGRHHCARPTRRRAEAPQPRGRPDSRFIEVCGSSTSTTRPLSPKGWRRRAPSRRSLAFDLGGGTFDDRSRRSPTRVRGEEQPRRHQLGRRGDWGPRGDRGGGGFSRAITGDLSRTTWPSSGSRKRREGQIELSQVQSTQINCRSSRHRRGPLHST